MRIKIIQKGWEGYNGILGQVQFVNGMSVKPVSQRERDYFSTVMLVAEVDDDGNEVVFSANDELGRIAKLRMEPVERRKSVAELNAEASANQPPEPEVQEPSAPDPMPVLTPVPEKLYTAEELEKIADEKGIRGLREIGTPLGAKNTSISKIIDEILQAQAVKAKG